MKRIPSTAGTKRTKFRRKKGRSASSDIKVNHDRIAKKCISNFTDDVDANDRIRSLIR